MRMFDICLVGFFVFLALLHTWGVSILGQVGKPHPVIAAAAFGLAVIGALNLIVDKDKS